MIDGVPRWARATVVAGLIWALWAAVASPSWTATILVFAPFVVVPLGLQLASRVESGPQSVVLVGLASLAPLLALSAALSFSLDPGALAAVAAVPWFVFTLTVSVIGAARILSRRTLLDPTIAVDAGLIFLVVGGSWMVISRAGWAPMGFSDAIVELTAVHFHYAGFALPIVVGIVAGRLEASAVVPTAVIAGVPLTALGISFGGGWLEWVTATFMAAAGIATAAQLLRYARSITSAPRWLLIVASVCLFAGMIFSLGWSWSMRFGWKWLAIEEMAATHGSLNALGFGLLALVGLTLSRTEDHTRSLVALCFGRPQTSTLQRIAAHAGGHEPTCSPGLLHRDIPAGFSRDIWKRDLKHGDFSAAKQAIVDWAGHAAAGVAHWPERPDITVGSTVALAVPTGPLTVTASTRIVEVIDERDRFGFAYATLPHHPEDGEESFVVSRHADGKLDVTITAVSRPTTIAARLCPPISRLFQHRVVDRYLDGLARPPS